MATTEIECSQCGSHDYQLLSSKTGEVTCPYCRSRWIEASLIQKSETEKFLELQAQQPKIVIDNTSETDKKLMDMLTGLMNPGGCLKRVATIVIGAIVALVLIIVVIVLLTQSK